MLSGKKRIPYVQRCLSVGILWKAIQHKITWLNTRITTDLKGFLSEVPAYSGVSQRWSDGKERLLPALLALERGETYGGEASALVPFCTTVCQGEEPVPWSLSSGEEKARSAQPLPPRDSARQPAPPRALGGSSTRVVPHGQVSTGEARGFSPPPGAGCVGSLGGRSIRKTIQLPTQVTTSPYISSAMKPTSLLCIHQNLSSNGFWSGHQ